MITITTPASTRDLTTAEYVLKEWKGKDPDTDLLALMISAASETMALWCRREFVQQVYTELAEASERRKQVLTAYPIVTPPTPVVTVSGDAVTNFDVYVDQGWLWKNDGTIWTGPTPVGGPLGASVLAYDRNPEVEVVYTAGWVTRAMNPAAIDLPADLEDAAIYFAIQLLKSSMAKPVGDSMGVTIGQFKTQFPAADSMTGSGSGYWAEALGDPSIPWMPLRVRRVLMQYRRFV